jgi:hypothetical protein
MFSLLLLWSLSAPVPPPPVDPPLSDLSRFPDREYVRQALALNQSHEKYLKRIQSYWLYLRPYKQDRWWEYEFAIDATGKLCWPYFHLHNAQDESQTEAYRRGQLRLLRQDLGTFAYVHGVLPDPVPIFSCAELD